MKKIRDIDTHFKALMKNPKFREAWADEAVEYKIAHEVIKARLANKLTQSELAEKMNTKQQVISRLESGTSTPSLTLIKRVAEALNATLHMDISFGEMR